MIITWKSVGLEMVFLSQFEIFDLTPPDIQSPTAKKGVGVTPQWDIWLDAVLEDAHFGFGLKSIRPF